MYASQLEHLSKSQVVNGSESSLNSSLKWMQASRKSQSSLQS